MSNNEIIPVPNLAAPEFAEGDQIESMTERLITHPSARYRLREALKTFNIDPPERFSLGYYHRPLVQLNYFYPIFDVPFDPDDNRNQGLANALLDGSMELRGDLSFTFDTGTEYNPAKQSDLATFRKLPALLAYIASYKAIKHAYLNGELVKPDDRQKLVTYFTDRLDATPVVAEDILQSAAIVTSDELIRYCVQGYENVDIKTSGVDTRILLGPHNPERGQHLGYDLESAVSESLRYRFSQLNVEYLGRGGKKDRWRDEDYQKDHEQFWPETTELLNRAVSLINKPEAERAKWSAYLFGKAVFAYAFEPRTVEGYDAGVDELGSWKEPREDKEYDYGVKKAEEWLRVAEEQGFNLSGLDLARQSFAIDLIDTLDTEIAMGSKQPRSTRIGAVAKLVVALRNSNPELAESVLGRSALLRTITERMMNPWGYKFGKQLADQQ